MESKEANAEKASQFNEMVKDIRGALQTYLFFELIATLFGVEEILYNIDLLQERLYIPLFVGACLIFAGVAQFVQYFRLRRKYSRLL